MSQRNLERSGGALFADAGQDGLIHRAFLRGEGFSASDVRRSPIIGICSSWSELNPCNAGLRDLADVVKASVYAVGGLALEFPTISISEPFARPSSMLLRNLMSMDVEESILSAPIDGVVLLAGCDKTVPAQLMGAISADKPAIMLTAGPRPVPCLRGEPLTIDELWPMCARRWRAELSDREWGELESTLNVGVGTCNVMGTAITMAAVAEMLGFALPGSALAPASSDVRRTLATATGKAIVAAVRDARTPRSLVTPAALENAGRVVCALGGSTNAVIHLESIAGRAGHRIGIETFGKWSASTPVLANVRPVGTELLSDLDAAGGVPAVVRALGPLLDGACVTASGATWLETLGEDATAERARASADPHAEDAKASDNAATPAETAHLPTSVALMSRARPLSPRGAIITLRGSLAPRGAIFRANPQSETAWKVHRGPAVIFEGVDDLNARIDDPALDVTPDSVLVLRGVGILGAPGMPEVGHIPIPAKLAAMGVRDMLRLSDARMSGTSTGAVVLHITPEAAVGGPLGLLRDGDIITLDLTVGTLDHALSPDELLTRPPYALRREAARERSTRGYMFLHRTHALQPDEGCDFDFLRGDFAG